MAATKPRMRFMGIELIGKDVGGADERWETDVKRFCRDLPLMLVLGVNTTGKWFVIVTCRSKSIQLGVRNRPSKRAALAALKKRVLLAQEDLAAFGRVG